MAKGVKSIETKHYEERDAFFAALPHLSRRSFFKLASLSATIAMGIQNALQRLALEGYLPTTVMTSNVTQFTIDLVPAIPGQLLTSLKPVRTLGPFPGPCLDLLYTSNGQLVAVQQDDQNVTKTDWFLTVIDPVRNTIVRTARIPVPGAAPWQFPFSVSADARLAAVAPRPRTGGGTAAAPPRRRTRGSRPPRPRPVRWTAAATRTGGPVPTSGSRRATARKSTNYRSTPRARARCPGRGRRCRSGWGPRTPRSGLT